MRGMPHTDSALWKFFRLTRISQISRFSFDGGKSHGGSTVCGFWAHTDSTDLTEKIREIRAIRVRFSYHKLFPVDGGEEVAVCHGGEDGHDGVDEDEQMVADAVAEIEGEGADHGVDHKQKRGDASHPHEWAHHRGAEGFHQCNHCHSHHQR